MFHQYFHYSAAQEYRPLQLIEARKMLFKLLETPDDFFQHIRQYVFNLISFYTISNSFSSSAAATIMRITYGIEIEEYNDPNVTAAELAVQHFADAGTPGAFMVDIFPIRTSSAKPKTRGYGSYSVHLVKYVPEWFPGGGHKKIGRIWKSDLYESRDLPYETTKRLVVSFITPQNDIR